MRTICFDLTALEMVDREGGIGRYAAQLFSALRALGLPLTALVASNNAPVPARQVDLDALTHTPRIGTNRHRFQRRLLAPFLLRQTELFHSTTLTALPSRVKTVATVHDLIALDFPYPGHSLNAYARRMKARVLEQRRLKKPDHLIAISDVTKAAVLRWSKRAEQDVSVTPLAVDHARFRPSDARAVREKYGLPENYVISVGSDHYRKNQKTLFDAWEKSGGALVLVGKSMYGDVFPRLQARGKANFFWLANVSDDELPALYSGASCAVAPSKAEGFGLTLLEAMACGAPVIAADQPAYREVGQSAVQYTAPEDGAALAEKLRQMQMPGEREAWSERGILHAQKFTWRATAEATAKVYEKLLR